MKTDKAIQYLIERKDQKSVIFFEYTQKQVDKGLRPTKKRKITKHLRDNNTTFLVTLGRLSYSETEFIKRFHSLYGVWPADHGVDYPKKRK